MTWNDTQQEILEIYTGMVAENRQIAIKLRARALNHEAVGDVKGTAWFLRRADLLEQRAVELEERLMRIARPAVGKPS